ncbi:MAG: hypothetical protein ACK5OC_25585 [Pirellula sp.]|jgi:hypothetical protein
MSTITRPTQVVEEGWLECQVDKGMFSDELAVTYPPRGAWQKSVFVDRRAVKGDIGAVGKVRVVVLRQDGSLMAVLPSPEQDIVYVMPGDISE